jgi:protease-4
VSTGLVDALLYEDQVWAELARRNKQASLERVTLRDYMRALPGEPGGRLRVAVVVGEGAISRGGGESDPFTGEEGIRSGAFIRLLRQVRNDASVRGVILRVNSPGGDAIASDEILHEVKLLSKAKPLVVSMSDAAASGGYYISMTGDPVIAYPNTFTGSIGVVYGKINIAGLYQKLGITTEIITRGRNAAIDSSTRPMTPEGRRKLKEGIDTTYRAFLDRVAEGRKKKVADIEPLAQGRVWMGAEAKRNGLVDEIGGLDRAIELLRKRANLGVDERIRLVPYPPKRSLFDQLFSSGAESGWSEARLSQVLARRRLADLARSLGLADGLDPLVWGRGAILRLAPYSIRLF